MPPPVPPQNAELPHVGWEPQRAAAARNHEAILKAARALFEQGGVDNVDVRQIAQASGVGMGTLYRRFGDKASIIAALVGDEERKLQDALLTGPPPLGPGAPPPQRLESFLRTLANLTERNLELLYASEASAPQGRYHIGAYTAWHQHTAILLTEIGTTLDPNWLADVLLAPLAPALYRHHRFDYNLTPPEIADRVVAAARTLTTTERLSDRHRRADQARTDTRPNRVPAKTSTGRPA